MKQRGTSGRELALVAIDCSGAPAPREQWMTEEEAEDRLAECVSALYEHVDPTARLRVDLATILAQIDRRRAFRRRRRD